MQSLGDVSAYLYVMSDDDQVKVGLSVQPKVRAKEIGRARGKPVALAHTVAVAGKFAVVAEGYAHWLLREHNTRGEWFSAPVEVAISATNRAAEEAATGCDLPQFFAAARWRRNRAVTP